MEEFLHARIENVYSSAADEKTQTGGDSHHLGDETRVEAK